VPQFGAYNFATKANFCTLEMAMEPEEDGVQE